MALLCDAEGIVKEILRDDLIEHEVQRGRSVLQLLDAGSLDKGRALLAQVQEHAVFGWEMNVSAGQRVVPLHFAGVAVDGGLLLLAYTTANNESLYEYLSSINNEQANALRRVLKEQSLQARDVDGREAHYLDELTRVNNELVNLQRELTRQNRELDTLNRQKNELLGMAAHDLRNPLAVVLAYSKVLLSLGVGPLNDKQIRFLSSMQSSSEFMLRMLEDLLDISQIEAGKLRLELSPIDLHAQLVSNLELNAVLAEKKGISLEFTSQVTSAPVLADPAKIEQVLNNLVSNALKFSPPGTTVNVDLSADETGYEVEVRDQGPGIPPAEQERLFRPFSTTSVKSTGGEKSTGLGLAIVKKIVSGHGGKVWVESEAGRGSSFHFQLPRRSGA